MLDSLRKLWPRRNALSMRKNSKGEMVPLLEAPVLPGAYEGDNTFIPAVIVAFLLGLVVVYLMDRFSPPIEEEMKSLEEA